LVNLTNTQTDTGENITYVLDKDKIQTFHDTEPSNKLHHIVC